MSWESSNMVKILIVDDLESNLLLLEKIITKHMKNCTVKACKNPQKAIEEVMSFEPDVILLDIQMPQKNGFELCSELKSDEKTKHIPIAFITAVFMDYESKIKGLNLGADAFLTKPIDAGELIAQLNVLIRIKQAEDKLRKKNIELQQLLNEKSKQLNESQQFYKMVFKNKEIIMLLINPNSLKIIDANPAAIKFYGYNNLKDLSIHELSTKTIAEIKHEFTGMRNHVFKGLNSEHVIADGSVKQVLVHSRIVRIEGERILFSIIIDVSDQKEQEKIIKDTYTFNQQLFDDSPYGIIVYNEKGDCINANESAAKIVGANDTAQLLSQNFYEIVSWKKSGLHELAEEVLTQHSKKSKLINMITSFGIYTWLEINLSTIRMNNQTNLVLTLNDLTDNKEYEKIIQNNLAYQELISNIAIKLNKATNTINALETILTMIIEFIDASCISIYKIDYDKQKAFKLAEHNSTEANYSGSIGKSLVNCKDCQVLINLFKNTEYIAFEDINDAPEDIQQIFIYRKTKSLILFPLYINYSLYGFVFFEETLYYRKWRKTHIEVLKSASSLISNALERDHVMQVLKASEEKFRQLSVNINDAVILLQKDTIIYSNPAIKSIFAIEQLPEEVSIREYYKFLKVEDNNLKKCFSYKKLFKDNFNKEIKIKLHTKKDKWIWVRTFLIKDEQNTQDRRVIIISDISARKELENKIIQTVIQTEEIERKRFALDLHDGIGPLLSSIKLYANLFKVKIRKNNQLEYIELIKNVEDIVKEAVKVTRTIANDLMPSLLSDYGIQNAIEQFIARINKTEVIIIDLKSNLGIKRFKPEIEINTYRMIKELINNSVKHAECKKIFILMDYKDQELSIEYRDDGKGFDIEQITKSEDKGLGLNSLRNRAKSANGEIYFESVKGSGFRAKIELKTT